MVHDVLRNLIKDARVELRSRFALNVSAAFAIIVTTAIGLTAGGIPFPPLAQSILLWVIVFFSAMNGLSHIFVRETDQGTALFLRVTVPVDSIFISKFIYNQAFMALVLIIVAPLFIFFVGMAPRHVGQFAAVLFSGGAAIAATTTILAAMVAKSGGRGSLFTILSFPVLLPVLWVSISFTSATLEAMPPQGSGPVFLLAFSGFITVISFLLFRFVWTDE